MDEQLPHLSSYGRAQLARLGREYMVAAHFNGRAGYAGLAMNHGVEAYRDVAIDNWMGASPVYTRRMQQCMGFAGDDVATIFKGMQLECGFAHQYFDVHFEVEARDRGRFWLNSCGPLLETEPRGDDAVRTMCHDIEDPTFDATAVATNPRARVRPVHRPPRRPADRSPHCEWRVFIDSAAEALSMPAISEEIAATHLARVAIARRPSREPGGMEDYRGDVLQQLHLEHLSQGALAAVCSEFAVQAQLLAASLMLAVARRWGDEAARAVGEFQMQGGARIVSERMAAWLGCEDGGLDAVLAVLAVHPAFQPREYIDLQLERLDEHRARLSFGPCPAREEVLPYGWFALLRSGCDAGLDSLVKGADPRARVERRGDLAWDIILDEATRESEEPLAVQIARGTVLYRTALRDRIDLLQL